jgi:antibiotic biosynthesis monooxygenase (ABM) superfamily enzyme
MNKIRVFLQGKQKQTLMVWLAVYPIITGLAWMLEPVLQPLQLPFRTLILSGLMVPIMVYGAMPLINSLLSRNKS